MGETMATKMMGTTMTAVSLLALRPCCGPGIRVDVLVAWDAWTGVAFVVGVDVVPEAEFISAESVVVLPFWKPYRLLIEFGVPLTVMSLVTVEAAEFTALLGFRPTAEMSASKIGPTMSPLLLGERRWRWAASWMSTAIAAWCSTARFNQMTKSVDAN